MAKVTLAELRKETLRAYGPAAKVGEMSDSGWGSSVVVDMGPRVGLRVYGPTVVAARGLALDTLRRLPSKSRDGTHDIHKPFLQEMQEELARVREHLGSAEVELAEALQWQEEAGRLEEERDDYLRLLEVTRRERDAAQDERDAAQAELAQLRRRLTYIAERGELDFKRTEYGDGAQGVEREVRDLLASAPANATAAGAADQAAANAWGPVGTCKVTLPEG